MKNWFKDYFTLYYIWGDNNKGHVGKNLRSRESTEEQIEGIIKLVKLKKDDLILDLPCGYGRHSIGLATRGLRVIGGDINDFFLKVSRYRADNGMNIYEEKVYDPELTKKASFKKIDMRSPPKKFKNKFDCVANLFLSFGYFSHKKDLKVLKNFYNMLRPGGSLILHPIFCDKIMKKIAFVKERERKVYPIKILGKKYPGATLIFKKKYENQIFYSTWQIKYKDKLYPNPAVTGEIRIYTVEEYKEMLRKAGFSEIIFYKDWKLNKLDDKADELIIHAIK